jgi:hypothetical protein
MPDIAVEIPSLEGCFVRYDPTNLTVFVRDAQGEPVFRRGSTLAFLHAIAVGELGVFVVADLVIGVSVGFRIGYCGKSISEFTRVARFVSDGVPKSAVSDIDGLVATACEGGLVLWNIVSGTRHRRIETDDFVVAVAFDAAFHGVLIATVSELLYLTVNGEVLCESPIRDVRVTACTFVQLPLVENDRLAIIGTSDGQVLGVAPNFKRRSLKVTALGSVANEVREIVVHRSKKAFATADASGAVCLWTVKGPGGIKWSLSQFALCCGENCGEKPVQMCLRCGCALCAKCLATHRCVE